MAILISANFSFADPEPKLQFKFNALDLFINYYFFRLFLIKHPVSFNTDYKKDIY